MKYRTLSIILLSCLLGIAMNIKGQAQSELVYLNEYNKLEYKTYTEKGDVIPDFSNCGYMGGGGAIPNIPVVATIAKPSGNDDTTIIQSIIDSMATLKLDEKGFRGTILLKKGTYKIASPLKINASGIVLRGEGNNKKNGTILLATSPYKYNVIELGGDAKLTPLPETEHSIIDEYVPSGSNIIHVKDAEYAYFRTGDKVVIQRPSTAEWIHAIGMDSIATRPLKGETTEDSFLRLRRDGTETNANGTKQWQVGTKDLFFERTITHIDADRITLDIPLTNALQKEFGGAKIYKYKFPERISNCGVENIYGMSVYDENVIHEDKFGKYIADEKHANNFVACKAIENAWVRNVNVEHFDCLMLTTPQAKFITGEDLSAINPVSIITGGRRYAYSVSGQMCLFQRCYSNQHRHEFVLGASVAGPNAFVEGKGDMTYASSEPHQRWAAGCLYDNITIKGPEASLLAVNRGWFGSGHGWAGAQIVFWNCSAPVIMVMQPPTAQNFAIGNNGSTQDKGHVEAAERTIRSINGVSRSNFTYQGSASVGDGWIEMADKKVKPSSLYYQQLKDRLGIDAVKNIMNDAQFKAFIKEDKK